MKDNGLKLQERKRFTDNAFFLWNHRKRILSDNRMSQCRLYIGNNLAFINVEGIASNTLGGYLTWWKEFERARRTSKHNRRSFIYFIGGSPLSGRNHCGEVYESGKTKTITVAPFNDYWRSFAETQRKFLRTDNKEQAYTLEEVIKILKQEDKEISAEICKRDGMTFKDKRPCVLSRFYQEYLAQAFKLKRLFKSVDNATRL